MDRRTLLTALLGTAGAGTALGWSRVQSSKQRSGAEGRRTSLAEAQQANAVAGTGKTVQFAQLPLGGGGFVTGIDISSDASRFVCRTDVANAYVREASAPFWRPLFSPASLKASDIAALPRKGDKVDSHGVAGVALAPSSPDVIYASYRGLVWKSVNGGREVQRTNLEQKRMFANSGAQRLFNPTIAIDPLDPAVVVVGTWGDGVWYSADGGTRWQAVRLPQSRKWFDGQPGTCLVAFAPRQSRQLYVFVNGVGLFRSDAGPGGSFTHQAGGPAFCSNLVPADGGSVFVCEQTSGSQGGKLWRFQPDRGWTFAQPEREGLTLALDPHTAGHALLIEANGFVMETVDGGSSFRGLGVGRFSSDSNEVAWMAGLKIFFPAEARFDPKAKDRLWIAQGVGVASSATDRQPVLLEDWSAGIEELCVTSVLSVPKGKTYLSAWDKPFWRIDGEAAFTNDFRYPLRPGSDHNPDLVAFASSLDFAPDDPSFLVGVVAPSEQSGPGYSTDGGISWRVFDGTPVEGWGLGGCIAASTKRNFVLLPSNNGVGQYTLDGGRSWSPIRLNGVDPTGGFSNAYFVARKNLSADKSRPGVFGLVYTIIKNDAYAEPLGGFWITRDGGKSWTQQLQGVISPDRADPATLHSQGRDPRQFWQCQLEFVPGRSGELLYTPHADFKADEFLWSQDDGHTWVQVHKEVRNVRCFGFGKAYGSEIRPSVCFWGEVKGRQGLYVSLDWFRTAPIHLSSSPSTRLADIVSIAGELERFGKFYLGTDCAGLVKVDLTF